MAYTFKQMKKGSYFGNVNDHSSDVYQKVSTYEFSDVRTGEVFEYVRQVGKNIMTLTSGCSASQR